MLHVAGIQQGNPCGIRGIAHQGDEFSKTDFSAESEFRSTGSVPGEFQPILHVSATNFQPRQQRPVRRLLFGRSHSASAYFPFSMRFFISAC